MSAGPSAPQPAAPRSESETRIRAVVEKIVELKIIFLSGKHLAVWHTESKLQIGLADLHLTEGWAGRLCSLSFPHGGSNASDEPFPAPRRAPAGLRSRGLARG